MLSDADGIGQLAVDVVAAILNGHDATAPTAGYHRDGLAAVAAQREQEGIQFLVIGLDPLNDVLSSLLCTVQSHMFHLIQSVWQLALANHRSKKYVSLH